MKGSNPRSALVRTDANGKFKLKAALKPPPLVIAHPSGFAELRADALEQNPTVKLQAWGRIEGVLKNGTQPAANEQVSLSHGILDFNYDSRHFRAVTDEQGRFAFTHVPPGDRRLARLVPLGPRSMLFSHSELVEVKPGEVSHVVYGGTGRPITGRLKLSDPAVSPDWSNGHFSIRPKTPVFRQLPNGGTLASASYGFTVNLDGSFTAHNVPAGRYTLSLDLRDPSSAGSVPSVMLSRPVATLRQDFEVPEIPGGVSDEPFDLGTLILSVVKSQ